LASNILRPARQSSSTLQAGRAPVAAVGVRFCVLRQFQFRHNSAGYALVSKNTEVSEDCESLRPRVEHHPAAWGLVVLHVCGNGSSPLILLPHFAVTPRMRQLTTVWLCGTDRSAFHYQFAANQPEDSESWLWHLPGVLALAALNRFLHSHLQRNSQLLPDSLDIGTMGVWGA
jgi:hypothetical protein